MDHSSEIKSENCKNHGEFESRPLYNPITKKLLLWTSCPVCAEEKRIKKEQEEAKKAADEKKEILRRKMKRAGIPKRFLSRSLENYSANYPKQQHALALCKKYAENFSESLEQGSSIILTGNTGTGKTHLATAIANHIVKQNYSAYFCSVRECIGDIKDSWRDKTVSEKEKIKQFAEFDLLILDEVGVQFDTDTEKMILFDVLNARYLDMKPTIIISNYPIDDEGPSVKKLLGDRVIDRFRENGGVAIQFDWPSFRSKTRLKVVEGK